MQFALTFSNLILQIALPMPTEDSHLMNEDCGMAIEFWPHTWDAPERAVKFGESEDTVVDMSGTIAMSDNCELKIHFEKVEQVSAQ